MQTVALIDYGSGNLRSAAKALERAAAECGAERRVVVTSSAAEVSKADRIVLPGVGAFADCKRGLEAVPDMLDTLKGIVLEKGRPFLGICVGMQLLAERSREFGVTGGLGWIPGEVVRLEVTDPALKIPHMGWNELELARPHPLMANIATGSHAYFVHSYHMAVSNPDHVIARTDFDGPVTAVIGRDNIAGTQFHPEKSQATGLALIANFLTWEP